MFKGDFKFNLRDALGQGLFYFSQYEQAYCITNEPIEEWMDLTPIKQPRVLTVAASGDQPLMYAAHGAKHVDTFDSTLNACVILDFKTAALKQLNYSQYLETAQELRHLDMLVPSQYISRVVNNMPERTRELMQGLIKHRPDVFQRDMYDNTIFPTNENTYAKMQLSVKEPFNFIWANLMNMHNYIEGKYDIINTSNIFEHYLGMGRLPADIRETIENLWPYLNVGGYILCTTIYPGVPKGLKAFQETWDAMGAKVTIFPHKHDKWKPIVIQKTR